MSYHPLDDTPQATAEGRAVLLAVDLGLRTGLATFNRKGRVLSYRSTNFGSVTRLKRGAHSSIPTNLEVLFTEGDAHLASIWERTAEKRGMRSYRVAPHEWRAALYRPGQMRDARDWKHKAVSFAERIIAWSGCQRPTSLRHDAAEAICIGLYAALKLGWLQSLPDELKNG
jgi:hypothetical protein